MSESRSAGFAYFPDAFSTGMYELGSRISHDDRFYRAYVSFLLKTLLDPWQLVHGRAELVGEVQRLAPNEPVVRLTWCSISLATDRYFDEKGLDYAWTDEEISQAKTQWLELISRAFVPSNKGRRIDVAVLRDWRESLSQLQRRDVGPLAACDMCNRKCVYSYDVRISSSGLRQRFDEARQHEQSDAAVARLALNICKNIAGQMDTDLAFCIAANSVQHQDTVEETQCNFMKQVRASIISTISQHVDSDSGNNTDVPSKTDKKSASAASSVAKAGSASESSRAAQTQQSQPGGERLKREQVLEVIVRVALSGSAWQQICAESMQANQITAEEVEDELRRRRKASTSAEQ